MEVLCVEYGTGMFQFLIGSLKTLTYLTHLLGTEKFQFLIGSLKTEETGRTMSWLVTKWIREELERYYKRSDNND